MWFSVYHTDWRQARGLGFGESGWRFAPREPRRGNGRSHSQDRYSSDNSVLPATHLIAPSPVSDVSARWVWPRSIRQARAHALITAVILWSAAVVFFAAGRGDRSIAGPLKAADFVHFYTLGALVKNHQTQALYDFTAQHYVQVALVPESSPESFIPVYPPQVAVLFAPFSWFSYRTAALLWSLLTIAVVGLIVRSAWRPVANVLPDAQLVLIATVAFPPFWSLILHGQTTVLALVPFWAGWLALEHRRPFGAGLAFGLLLVKPQLGIPLAVLVLARREWAMLAGAITSALLQVLAVVLILGWPVLAAYVRFTPAILKYSDLLEPKAFQTHSLMTLARLAPSWMSLPAWIIMSAVVVSICIATWNATGDVRVRMGMLILATVLVSPHLNVYDATLVAMPLIWFGAYINERCEQPARVMFWTCTYWLFVAFLAPTARVIGIQISVILMAMLLAQLGWLVTQERSRAAYRY